MAGSRMQISADGGRVTTTTMGGFQQAQERERQASLVSVLPSTPRKKATPKRTARSSGSGSGGSRTRASSSGRGGGGGGGGGGGYSGPKSADKAQVDVLKKLLSKGFAKARDQRLANIETGYQNGDRLLLDNYGARAAVLGKLREDTEKSEAGASFANLGNRARESGDILAEALAQGVGESDVIRAQLMAARNWAANQGEVARAFHDSISSNNSAINDLNVDTRSARFNLATQTMGDREQAHATYSNQMADAATQLGNITANPYSDSYVKGGSRATWNKMYDASATVWKRPKIGTELASWKGQAKGLPGKTNDAVLPIPSSAPRKRPEGATLRNW